MRLQEAQTLRRYYRGERARALKAYRRFKQEECLDLAAKEGERATFLEQQLSRVEQWIAILEANPGAEGRYSVSVRRAQVGRVIRVGKERHRVVGLGWADCWDNQGRPSMVKVATVPVEVAA